MITKTLHIQTCEIYIYIYIYEIYEIYYIYICMKVKEHVSHSVVSDSVTPLDCNPPDSSVHGISQTRIQKGVAVPFSSVSSPPRD